MPSPNAGLLSTNTQLKPMLHITKIFASILALFVLISPTSASALNAANCDMSNYEITDLSGTNRDYDDTVWPVDNISFSDAFGSRDLVGNYDFHRGIDLRGNVGYPVYSIADGTVFRIQPDCNRGEEGCRYPNGGNVLILRHNLDREFSLGGRDFSRYYSLYLHLDSFAGDLEEGKEVETGKQIGTLGSTDASYPHLHFETRVGTTCSAQSSCAQTGTDGQRIDPHVNPLYFLDFVDDVYEEQNDYDVCVETTDNLKVKFSSPRTELDFNEIEVAYPGGDRTVNFSTREGINLANVDENPFNDVDITASDFRSTTPTYVIEFDFQNVSDFDHIEVQDIWGSGKRIEEKTSTAARKSQVRIA